LLLKRPEYPTAIILPLVKLYVKSHRIPVVIENVRPVVMLDTGAESLTKFVCRVICGKKIDAGTREV